MNLRYVCVLLHYACATIALSAAALPAMLAAESPKGACNGLVVSAETTYITEPLNDAGWPKYTAFLNKRLGSGVTPKNNAVVLLLQAWGPQKVYRDMSQEHREEYFRMLGIAPVPAKIACFVDVEEYAKSQPTNNTRSLWEQYNTAKVRPWSEQEFPAITGWLTANQRSLALLVEASKQPRYYEPIVPRHNVSEPILASTYFDPVPYWSWLECRDMARTLIIRAMAKLYDGKVNEAWQDLLACHRLARLRGQGPTFPDVLAADTMESLALFGDRWLLRSDKLTPGDLKRIREDLDRLPPMPKDADKFDVGERLSCLNWALRSMQEGLGSLKEVLARRVRQASTLEENATERLLGSINGEYLNWNVVFQTINVYFDRIVAAQRMLTWQEQQKALATIHSEVVSKVMHSSNWSNPTDEVYSKRIGLAFILAGVLDDATTVAQNETEMGLELTKVALALTQYHVEHKVFPATLAQLVPKYVTRVPRDVFGDGELHYHSKDDGYLLYSVGPNCKDDGGRSFRDRFSTKVARDWDDIVVRIPEDGKTSKCIERGGVDGSTEVPTEKNHEQQRKELAPGGPNDPFEP